MLPGLSPSSRLVPWLGALARGTVPRSPTNIPKPRGRRAPFQGEESSGVHEPKSIQQPTATKARCHLAAAQRHRQPVPPGPPKRLGSVGDETHREVGTWYYPSAWQLRTSLVGRGVATHTSKYRSKLHYILSSKVFFEARPY